MDTQGAWKEFARMAAQPGDDIDPVRAALLIAAAEYPGLDIQGQLGVLDSLAAGASRHLGEERSPLACVNALSEYLFDELGFRGNPEEYYDPRNSFLNEVLGRRLGIPITLSLVYLEVGVRLGVPLIGIGMPGHFMVRHRDVQGLFIDPFHGGILLSEAECAQRWRQVAQADGSWEPRYLAPVTSRELIARMLRNLKGIYLRQQDHPRAVRAIEWLLVLQPEAAPERRDRGLVHYHLGNYGEALKDLEAYLDSAPAGADAAGVQRLVGQLRELLED